MNDVPHAMKVEVAKALSADRQALTNLLQLYLHDFSEIDGSDLGSDGTYGYPYLDAYWTDHGRHPFLIRADGKLAGFALVRILPTEEGDEVHMAEFFVVRKYRRKRVGEAAARQIFDAFPGRWVVTELAPNVVGQDFWRSVISRYRGVAPVERRTEKSVTQEFIVPR